MLGRNQLGLPTYHRADLCQKGQQVILSSKPDHQVSHHLTVYEPGLECSLFISAADLPTMAFVRMSVNIFGNLGIRTLRESSALGALAALAEDQSFVSSAHVRQ